MSKNPGKSSTKHDDETAMNKSAHAGRNDFVNGIEVPANVGHNKEDWIASQLRKVYDDAVNEDVPDDMMALLDQLDDLDTGSDNEGSSS